MTITTATTEATTAQPAQPAQKKAHRKGRSGDGLYYTAGDVGAALVAIGSTDAFNRHGQLVTLENACRAAEEQKASYDVHAALRGLKSFGSQVEAICDGAVASVGVLDPTRAASIPKKTGIEWKDPLAYALEVVHALGQGSPQEQMLAANVKQVADRYQLALRQVRDLRTSNAAAQDAVAQARLALRSYILDCKKFVLASTQADHPARKHFKKKKHVLAAAG